MNRGKLKSDVLELKSDILEFMKYCKENTLSIILIMVDKNNREMNLLPVKVKSESEIREKISKADADELKRLGIM